MMRKICGFVLALSVAVLMFGCSSSGGGGDKAVIPVDNGGDSADDGGGSGNDQVSDVRMEDTIRMEALMNHLSAFESIAFDTTGDRTAGSEAEGAAINYIREVLSKTNLSFSQQDVPFHYFAEMSAPRVSRLSPSVADYVPGEDFTTMTYSGSGSVTGELIFVTPMIPPGYDPNDSTDGCEAGDYASVDISGKIAVLQRGGCAYGEKAAMAEAQGASAVIIFNEGQIDRTEMIIGSLGEDAAVSIPVISVRYDLGAELYELSQTGEVIFHITVDTVNEDRIGVNLLAETPGDDNDLVILAGAHLDSAPGSPGINANGSGAAALLEFALQSSTFDYEPVQKMRFAWWTAYEQGRKGSTHYTDNLDDDQISQIAMYIDLDTIGSPNYRFGVLGGETFGNWDNFSMDTDLMRPGSDAIERAFRDYFGYITWTCSMAPACSKNRFVLLPVSDEEDYSSFAYLGIPIGGLSSGKNGMKTDSEEEIFGGTAGEPYDPCYQTLCDNIDNINGEALLKNTRAFASVMQDFAEKEPGLLHLYRRTIRKDAVSDAPVTGSGYDRTHKDRDLRSKE